LAVRPTFAKATVGRLLLATTNSNKVREIRPLLADLSIELITLVDLPPVPEPEESAMTFWENARIKALGYATSTGCIAVAEDSGLEIDAMDGEPGVHSARFMGANTSYANRFHEIFRRIEHHARTARFVTALAVARANEVLFETETAVEGEIAHEPKGQHGFGYDPIFRYPPFGVTTAQLPDRDKAVISHRARAFRDLRRWLRSKDATKLFRTPTNS
jgi:XTP/dITP diphosphohydrolase